MSSLMTSYVVDDNKLQVMTSTGEEKFIELSINYNVIDLKASIDGRFVLVDSYDTVTIIDSEFETSHQIEKQGQSWWDAKLNLFYYVHDNYLSIYDRMLNVSKDFKTLANNRHIWWIRPTSNAQYVIYGVLKESNNYDLFILDVDTGISTIVKTDLSTFDHVEWVDNSRLVYTYSGIIENNLSTDNSQQIPNKDLWIYDASQDKTTQLTNTPDVDEDIWCGYG